MEGLAELLKVLHRSIHAELARRMRIHFHHHPRVLRTPALAPDLSEADEETLRRRETVRLRSIQLLALGRERVLERQERDADAAVVCRVFPQRQLAIHVRARFWSEVVVLLYLAVGPLGERLAVR